MTPSTRDTILFWCQVGLYITAMTLLLGTLILAWYFITAQVRTLEEGRAKDDAMLQQHMSALQDHDRAREQHAMEFTRTLQHHEETMQRLAR